METEKMWHHKTTVIITGGLGMIKRVQTKPLKRSLAAPIYKKLEKKLQCMKLLIP